MTMEIAANTIEDMGPSLLAAQPITIPADRPQEDWSRIFEHFESSLASMRAWRWSWWAHWSRLAEFFLPRRYTWVVVANRMSRGTPINDAIVDSTACLALRVFAGGLWTGLTSPSRPWFGLGIMGVDDEELDEDAKEWLEHTHTKVTAILAGSNFYQTMAQAFEDVGVFGTAPVIMYEDSEDVIRCYLPCAGEYYLKVGSRLSVDTIYREFTLTVQQIVEQFKVENVPDEIARHWQAGGASLNLEYVVTHAIEPNFDISRKGSSYDGAIQIVPHKFDYREVYWLKAKKTNHALRMKGFEERPFFTARWSTVSNQPYGRSPGMDALGDQKQVQMETRRKGEFIEKLVRPPMGADPELKNEPSSIIPGNITYFNTTGGKKGFFPLFEVQPAALAPMVQDIKEIQARLERCFFVDVFMAISRMEGVQPRNELELTKRDLERLQVLGPFIHHFETEFANPAITRVMAIAERRGLLRPRPDSIRNSAIKITYKSIMRLAQIAAESVAMKDTFVTAGELSAAAKAAGVPDPIRTMDLDKSFQKYAELNNFPQDCLYTAEQVKKHDQVRQQAQQQADMAAQAPGAAMAAVDAASTLASTKVEGGSLLNNLLTGSTALQ
jgi:hypothetical protein